jgi:hypothetical protein
MKLPGTIPVRRYLKKYVLYIEQLPEGQALDLTRRGSIPLFLGSLLTGKLSDDCKRDKEMPLDDHFDDQLDFILDVYRSTRTRITLSYDAVRMFDAFLYHSFHDYLASKLAFARWINATEKSVIEKVMFEMDIVEDITFDALKKSQARLKKTRKNDDFFSQKCLSPPGAL